MSRNLPRGKFFFLLTGAVFFSCTELPYIGGACAENADCQSRYQSAPGTICLNERCVCADPSQHLCCARGETEPNCLYACRPCDECIVGIDGCPGTACTEDAQCPGPPDPRCGTGRCVAGGCEVEINAGPIVSQRRGDCRILECTEAGGFVSREDSSDVYDDGEYCTNDICTTLGPSQDSLPDDTACPAPDTSLAAYHCWGGKCVQCHYANPAMPDCPILNFCDREYCVPAHCGDHVFDPSVGETAEDCGGACFPCNVDKACQVGADCGTGVCIAGLCQAPTCSDGVKNGTETGVDCGSLSCPLCPPGQGCKRGEECVSGVCWAGICQEPSCIDGVRNDGEIEVDCGGNCPSCP